MAESLTMLHDSDQVTEVFRQPSLQMVSFTITEKGYSLRNAKHELMPAVAADIRQTALKRLQELHGAADRDVPRAFPPAVRSLALVSMDNCSHNGEKLQRPSWRSPPRGAITAASPPRSTLTSRTTLRSRGA